MEKEITVKNVLEFAAVIVVLAFGMVSVTGWHRGQNNAQSNATLNTSTNHMNLSSSAFAENQTIPKIYTCDESPPAGGISPPLQISDVPAMAVSLVLILHDPDAPGAGGFTHWTIFNMDPSDAMIAENAKPSGGIEATNSGGKIGYTPPCPPSGTHRYQFGLYALDEKLSLDASATKADIEKAMEGHIIDQTILTGLYKHQ